MAKTDLDDAEVKRLRKLLWEADHQSFAMLEASGHALTAPFPDDVEGETPGKAGEGQAKQIQRKVGLYQTLAKPTSGYAALDAKIKDVVAKAMYNSEIDAKINDLLAKAIYNAESDAHPMIPTEPKQDATNAEGQAQPTTPTNPDVILRPAKPKTKAEGGLAREWIAYLHASKKAGLAITLDQLAKASGLSKSRLTQIHSGNDCGICRDLYQKLQGGL